MKLDRVAPWPTENHVCTACVFRYDDVVPLAVVPALSAFAARLGEVTREATDAQLRDRPQPGGWSAMEYACHLRDLFAVYTIRLHRASVEDDPIVEPMLNDVRAARFNYNGREISPVIAEIHDNAQGLGHEIAALADGWTRTVRRLDGETRTARWLVCQAAHEAEHHLRDIAGLLRPAADGS